MTYSPPRRGGVARSAGVVSSAGPVGRADHPVCAVASLGASTIQASPCRARASRPPLRAGECGAFLLLALLVLAACSKAMPEQATWAGTIELAQGNVHVPFHMVLDLRSPKPTGYFLVGDEKTPIPEITRQGESLTFGFSEYGAEMRGTWDGGQLNGTYARHRRQGDTLLKFSAAPDLGATSRSELRSSGAEFPSGKYQVYFEGEARNQSATVATFWMQEESLYGTFIAPDGDYGLLVGNVSGGKVQVNRFTGWQAIAMTLGKKDQMWSGNYYFQNDKPRGFVLFPQPNIDALPIPKQTTMKNPDAPFTFEGVSISGDTIRSSDDRFKGKSLIVDIMGTWCHNCLDSGPLLDELQKRYGNNGLQVVGISFEISDDVELAKKNLQLFKDRNGLTYTMLFCGSLDDENVNKRLRSQLNNFFAYPTTLFVGRDGKVRAINSGFKGPGTGEEYQAQIREFHELAEKLVK